MAITDGWRGFWTTDNPALRGEDSSGNGNHFVINTGGNSTPPAINIGNGRPKDARYYGSITDVNTVPNGSSFSFSTGAGGGGVDLAFGWSIFVSPSNLSQARYIFSKNNTGTPAFEWAVYLQANMTLVFRLYSNNSSANYIDIITNVPIPITGTDVTWTHIAGDYDGSRTAAGLRLFRNGEIETDVTKNLVGTYIGMAPKTTLVKVGANVSGINFGSSFFGHMDSLGIRSQVFTIDETRRLFNNGVGFNPFSPAGSGALLRFAMG